MKLQNYIIGVGWVGVPFSPPCKSVLPPGSCLVQVFRFMVLFKVLVGIIRMHGEADGLRREPTRDQEDLLSPCANTPVTITHPLPPYIM